MIWVPNEFASIGVSYCLTGLAYRPRLGRCRLFRQLRWGRRCLEGIGQRWRLIHVWHTMRQDVLRQSAELPLVDWSGNTGTARVGGG
jgi:hypothetical protein